MKITTISGVIQTLGESKYGGVKVYDYISILGSDGQDVIARKVRVLGEVDRLLSPGAKGTFIFAKTFFFNELHAIKVGNQEAYSGWLQGEMGKVYLGLILALILSLALSFILIGIPFAILTVWAMIKMPSWKAMIVNTACEEGFKLSVARRI